MAEKKKPKEKKAKAKEPKEKKAKAKEKKEDKKEQCIDVNCPFHGTLSTRGAVMDGVVASDKMNKTVVVQRNYYIKSDKYGRYLSKKSRISAHNPPCIDAKVGDRVRIIECRKLSKTKSFVVIEKLP